MQGSLTHDLLQKHLRPLFLLLFRELDPPTLSNLSLDSQLLFPTNCCVPLQVSDFPAVHHIFLFCVFFFSSSFSVVWSLCVRPSALIRTPWLDLQNPDVQVQFGLSLETEEFIRNVDEGKSDEERVVNDIGQSHHHLPVNLPSPLQSSSSPSIHALSAFTSPSPSPSPHSHTHAGMAIGKNLYTFMSSFAQQTGRFKDLGDVLVIPTSCIDRWWAKFREKHQR